MQLLDWFKRPLSFNVKLIIVVASIPFVIGLLAGLTLLVCKIIGAIQDVFIRLSEQISWSPPTSLEGLVRTSLGLVILILILKFLFGRSGGGK